MPIFKRVIIFLALILLSSNNAFAFDFQVTDSAVDCDADCTTDCSTCQNPAAGTPCSFQGALNIAQCNGETDVITLAAGTYDPTVIGGGTTVCSDTGFCYDGADDHNEGFSLTIMGAGIDQTIIDGAGLDGVVGLQIQGLGGTDSGLTLSISGITFQNCGNSSAGTGQGLQITNIADASVTLERNKFFNNAGENQGAGASVGTGSGSLTINRNAFFDNLAHSGVRAGGILASTNNGTIVFTNNILAGNIAENNLAGGALLFGSVAGSTLQVVNNTFFNNDALTGGGLFIALCESGATANVFNNIVYQNADAATATGADIFAGSSFPCNGAVGTLNVSDNDYIEIDVDPALTSNIDGVTNINVDPLWVNSAGDDFHLTGLSPVIDQGNPAPPGGLPTPDFDGVTRPQLLGPDMGALEFVPICGDGRIDAPEQCDPQNTAQPCAQGTICNPTTCQCTGCGDGVVTAPETCDPPNGTTCDATCQLTAVCGNGILETGEECDDGNLDNNDGCSSLCLILCVAEGSGCGDDGPNICGNNGGLTPGGASLIPMDPSLLVPWVSVFVMPGTAFIGLRIRRRFKK